MLNDSFSCRSTFFCILRDKNGYTIINGTGNYYTEAQTREQTRRLCEIFSVNLNLL